MVIKKTKKCNLYLIWVMYLQKIKLPHQKLISTGWRNGHVHMSCIHRIFFIVSFDINNCEIQTKITRWQEFRQIFFLQCEIFHHEHWKCYCLFKRLQKKFQLISIKSDKLMMINRSITFIGHLISNRFVFNFNWSFIMFRSGVVPFPLEKSHQLS